MTDSRYEKYFLIALPCMAVLIAGLILPPRLLRIGNEEMINPSDRKQEISIVEPSNKPQKDEKESPKPESSTKPEDEEANANGIIKKDENKKDEKKPSGGNTPGKKPSPKPSANPLPKPTEKPASNPNYEGHYDGGAVEHVEIENIDAVITIVDDTDLSAYEQSYPGEPEAPVESEAEIIVTPPEAQGQDNTIVETSPILDARGYQTYEYTFNLGPNGCLLLKNGEESEVYPVDENGDGIYDYGEYFFAPTTPEEGTESGLTADGYYKSESLFNSDNTPVDKYDIDAEPLYDEISKKVGWQQYDGRMYYYDSFGEMVKGLKKIDGELCYFDQHGVKAEKLGIDVSFYNGDIDWQAVKAQGVDFAIIRVGGRGWESGRVYNDSMFEENIREAINAGIEVGVYFYSTAVNELEAVEEASYALQKTEDYNLALPIYIDMEFSNDRPNGRSDNMMPYERTAIIDAFCETVENSGRLAGVYSGQNFYRDHMEVYEVNDYNTWLASYTRNNRLPDFRGRYDMW